MYRRAFFRAFFSSTVRIVLIMGIDVEEGSAVTWLFSITNTPSAAATFPSKILFSP